MLLKSMSLENFRQYRGKQTLSFSCDNKKNVTVILGRNTSGKTTLVDAFYWCFYGINKFDTKSLLNNEIEMRMPVSSYEHVSVEIAFSHKGEDFIVKRSEAYTKYPSGEVKPTSSNVYLTRMQSDGQTVTSSGRTCRDSINEILPQDLSSYFFFGGENVKEISKSKNLSGAVKGLVGLNSMEKSIEHLKRTRRLFERELDLKTSGDGESIQKRIDEIEDRLGGIDKQISECDTQIEYYKSKVEGIREKLREAPNTAELESRKERLTEDIKSREATYDAAVKEFVTRFNDNPFAYFGSDLIHDSDDFIESFHEETVHTYTGVTDETIHQIIEAGVCICGTKINENSEEMVHLTKQLDYVPPKSISSVISEFKGNSEAYLDHTGSFRESLENQYNVILGLQKEIGDKKDDLEDIEKQLDNAKDAIALREEEKTNNEKAESFQDKKVSYVEERGALKNELQIRRQDLGMWASADEKNTKTKKYLTYVDALSESIGGQYKEREIETKNKLEKKVQENFKAMYHGHRSIKIDDTYHVVYTDVTTDESTGLETVKNFAFIAGLVDVAREKIDISEETGDATERESYPLVVDAPFSTVDEIHLTNISNVLTNVTDQLIMVIMEKDWEFAKNVLEPKVDLIYTLDKRSETYTVIKNEN